MLRVSVVEDQPDILRSLVRKIDRTEGMLVVSQFENGEEALEKIPHQKPDLVLMDIGLPMMDGIECMVKIKRLTPSIDFLMFTVFDNDKNVFDALKAGAVGYVLKSDRATGAIAAIEEYLRGGAPMSRDIARKVLRSFQDKGNTKDPEIKSLTPRQLQVLEQLAEGLLNKEIADSFGITEGAVKQHNFAIYKKLHVNNRIEAVRKYLADKG